MNADPLITTLIDLDRAIGQPSFKFILGGGFGLYLKQIHLQQANAQTVLPGDLWPSPPSHGGFGFLPSNRDRCQY
jgi:hypothetical protein